LAVQGENVESPSEPESRAAPAQAQTPGQAIVGTTRRRGISAQLERSSPHSVLANARTDASPVTAAKADGECGYLPDGGYAICTSGALCCKTTGANGGTPSFCVASAKDGARGNIVARPACAKPARSVGTVRDGGSAGTCVGESATNCP
jgi:hypothetical protein